METDRDCTVVVTELIAAACNCSSSQITPEAEVELIGLDSLSMASIAAHLSVTYACEFSETELLRLFQSAVIADIYDVMRDVLARS